MKFYRKHIHIGYSSASVPGGWVKRVEEALIEIEREMWPRWMPMFLKRWIHYLATGNSVVRIKYRWAYNLRTKLTGGQIVRDVKDKYAQLRIYASAGEKINDIIDKAVYDCEGICERCSGTENVSVVGRGWYENLCENCYVPVREILLEKY